MTETRVFIVDDDEAVVDSLSLLLRALGSPIESFTSGELFLQKVPVSARGCLIVDLRMPGLSGIDLLQRIRDLGYKLHVVMITGHADIATVTRVMKLGAIDFLEKPCPPALIVDAVRLGLERAAEGTARAQPLIEFQQQVDQLAPDERAVLEGLILGRTNPEIAEALDVSLRTVQARRSSIFEKLHVTNRAELVERALSAGWNPRGA
ncbi:MAG: response regulator transcription factor [Planctomycetaceae bacterium]|nr:response regulator transcription factor [Planctomycetaceae bacterium]